MKILAIESSALVASAAVMEDGILRCEYTINNALTHSVTLLPMIKGMCSLSGISIKDMDAIAVSAGPGSFTGLRIGAATAKGLALSLDIPVIKVSTLDSMGLPLSRISNACICPVMDARRGQVYCAAYRSGSLILQHEACDIHEFILRLMEQSGSYDGGTGGMTFLFAGDGADVHADTIRRELGQQAAFAEAPFNRQRAAHVALLGEEAYRDWLSGNLLTAGSVREAGAGSIGCYDDTVMLSDDLVPDYLRKSQAEQNAEKGLLEDAGKHSLKKMR